MVFRIQLTIHYTRISCRPYGASLEYDRLVQAQDREDAQRQACLCVERELEVILAQVNTANVSEVLVDLRDIQPTQHQGQPLWNESPFPRDQRVPRHLVVRAAPGDREGEPERAGRGAVVE